ncbi:MAG: lysophospholipase [Rhodanobacteraceae bacterium]
MDSRSGVVNHEEFIESVDGHRLFVRSWQPVSEPRAMLAIVHGFHSHSAYYERFAGIMADAGIATFALDLRGRGRSSGARYFVRQFSEYVEDIEAFVCVMRARAPAPPLFLLGHGAGGLVASWYAVVHPRVLAGLICESLALEVHTSGLRMRLVRALAFIAPRLPVLRLRSEQFSREEQVVHRMHADPLIRHERQSASTVAELDRAASRLRGSLPEITIPLLVLHGSADSVTLPSGSEFLHEGASSRDKTLQIFEGYYHDLINDRGHGQVIQRIRDWISDRSGSTRDRAQIGISYINNGS